MQCREVEELLSEYIDGVLDQQEHNMVDEHLQECTVCSNSLSDLQDTVRLLRSLGEVVPPVNFRKELREKLEEAIMMDAAVNKRKNHLRGLVSGYKRYAAIAAAIVGLGVGFYSFNQPQMDRYLGSSNKAAQQEIALDTASQYSTEAMRSSDLAAPEDSVKSKPEETTALNTGKASSATDSSAPLGFVNDPASAPPGMGEGIPPVKSMQAAGTSEATAGTAPEPDKANPDAPISVSAGQETPLAGGGAAAKAIQETAQAQSETEGKIQDLSGQKTEDAGESATAENERIAADKDFIPLVGLAVLAAGAAVGVVIYYLRRRV